jgi:hypothetical protein
MGKLINANRWQCLVCSSEVKQYASSDGIVIWLCTGSGGDHPIQTKPTMPYETFSAENFEYRDKFYAMHEHTFKNYVMGIKFLDNPKHPACFHRH